MFASAMPGDRAQTPPPRARTWARASSLTSPRDTLKWAVQGAKDGLSIVRQAPLNLPTSGHLRRLGYGIALPIAILRTLLRDPVERRRYLLLSGLRALFVLSVTTGLALLTYEVAGDYELKAGPVVITTKIFTLLSSLYGTLCAVEWSTIALTHEYDDQTARRASLLIGVPPEDPESRPRIRFDMPWILKRLKRRWRGFLALMAGAPVFFVVTALPVVGSPLYGALFALWSGYWLCVITASKSAASWRDEGSAPAPWFLRLWDTLTTSVPGFRWWLPRAYGRFWRKRSEAMFSPCKAVEDSPAPMAGLAILRAVGGLPCANLFLRPLLPVAAAHILFRRASASAEKLTSRPPTSPSEQDGQREERRRERERGA